MHFICTLCDVFVTISHPLLENLIFVSSHPSSEKETQQRHITSIHQLEFLFKRKYHMMECVSLLLDVCVCEAHESVPFVI